MAYLVFAAVCVMFGSNFILMHRATAAFGPLSIATLRMAGAGLVMLLCWRLTSPGRRIARRYLPHILVVGLVANAVPYLLQPYLMGSGFEHSYLGMMIAFTPLLTILLSVPLLGVWPTGRQVVGVVGGLVCLAIVMLDGSQRGLSAWKLALAAVVPLSYAVGNTYLKKHLQGVASIPLTAMIFTSTALLMLPIAAVQAWLKLPALAAPVEPSGHALAILSVFLLGVMGTGVSGWMFVWLVQRHGPLFAAMVTNVVPLLALLWGAVDGETITGGQLVAIGGAVAMVGLVQYRAATPLPKPERQSARDSMEPETLVPAVLQEGENR